MTYLERYLNKENKDKDKNTSKLNSGAISFLAALDGIAKTSPIVAEKIVQEHKDQRTFLKLIASEN